MHSSIRRHTTFGIEQLLLLFLDRIHKDQSIFMMQAIFYFLGENHLAIQHFSIH